MRVKMSVVICTMVLLALLSASVFAQTFTLDKSEYLQGQTPIASWTGLPIAGNQMQLYFPNDNLMASYFGWSWLDGSTGSSVDGPAASSLPLTQGWVENDGGTWPLPLGTYYLHIFSPGSFNTWEDVVTPITFTVVDAPSEGEGEGEGEEEVVPIIIASTNFATLGEALSLTAPAGASAPYQWYKLSGVEPVAIPGATNATLSFPLIGTANYGGSSNTVRIGSGTYSEDSIAFDGGTDEYLPTSDGGYQVFSGDDDAWTFEATFTSDTGALPEIGVTKIGGGGGYVELYVNFYYEYVYAWFSGGVGSGSYITIDSTEAITVRMEASATELVCSADSTTTGAVALGNYTRGAETGYRPWLYECYGTGYDFDVSDMTLTGYGIDAVNPAVGLIEDDLGIYALTYDDGAKATAWAYYDLSDPFPEGSPVPVASLVGLGLLAGVGLVGGMLRNRKK